MLYTHDPDTERRLNRHLANITVTEFCPGYRKPEMFRWTDWGIEHLLALLSQQGLQPTLQNTKRVAMPILRTARGRSMAYLPGDHIQSPVSPNFTDVVDCVLGLSLESTQTLMRRLRRLSQLLVDHCQQNQIAVRAWYTSSGYASLTNPLFVRRVLVSGAVRCVREGHGEQLLAHLAQDPDPLWLVKRALGAEQGVSEFVQAIADARPGHFGKGKAVFSRDPEAKPRSVRRRRQKRRVTVLA